MSGFHLLAGSFAPLGNLGAVLDSLLAWAAVSLVLSLTRILTGNIAVAVGLHAGWVVVLRWAAAIAMVLWSTRRVWVPYAAGVPSGASSASLSSLSSGSSSSR